MQTCLSFKRTKFLWATLLLAAVLTVVLVACGGQTTTAAPTATAAPPTQAPAATPTPAPATVPLGAVIIKMIEKTPGHYYFQPSAITIKAGTVVVWINMSDGKHTVTSNPGDPSAFNTTSVVTQNHTFALMFSTPGTYHYRCVVHPATMQAVITVTP